VVDLSRQTAPTDPQDPRWGSPRLPDWITEFRPHQLEAVEEIHALFESGRKVVFLDAPTGSGKTLIGEMTRRMVQRCCLYLCTTKTLQRQFVNDYPYGKLIQGRSNYPTLDRPDLFDLAGARQVTAADCNKVATFDRFECSECVVATPDVAWEDEDHDPRAPYRHCFHCHPWQHCPYEVAKWAALQGEMSIANTSYALTEANMVGRFSKNHPLWVIDEADALEEELMRFIEFNVGKRLLGKLRLEPPSKKTVPESWKEWIRGAALPRFRRWMDEVEPKDKNPDPEQVKEYNRAAGYVTWLVNEGPRVGEDWVYTGYDMDAVIFRPIKVDHVAPRVLWKHAEKFLLMSATIISPAQMAQDLGLADHEWGEVFVQSSFPIENRPVIVRPAVNMTAKTKVEGYPKMAAEVERIMGLHPAERILCHTNSYELTRYLAGELDPWRVISYESSRQRDEVLRRFKDTPNAVLLAPSFERGVDLPDNECRVQVICKVPFPYLGDKQVSKRMYSEGGQNWYNMITVRTIVQMSGRAVRHEGDHAVTYILDSQFLTNLWKRSHGMFPQWWKKAIRWEPV
jgi:Rad3-related DNA helicase